jgi:GH18 family chitinase
LVFIIVDTLYFQADLVWNNNLGGIFVWTIDMDDFSGSCGMKYPMMNAVLHGLHAYHDYLIEKNEVMLFLAEQRRLEKERLAKVAIEKRKAGHTLNQLRPPKTSVAATTPSFHW